MRRILSAQAGPGFEVREISSADFLRRYPAGFSPMSRVADGDYVGFSAERIANLAAALSPVEFAAFVRAIASWQHDTAWDFALGLAPETILSLFEARHPAHAQALKSVAALAGLDEISFLGATRPR